MGDKETLKINDKYTVVLDQDVSFKFYATRNGEQWRDLIGDNLILAMFQNLTTITDQYNAVVAQNKSLQGELNIYKRAVWFMAKVFIMQYKTTDLPFLNSKISNKVLEKSISDTIDLVLKIVKQELEAENERI